MWYVVGIVAIGVALFVLALLADGFSLYSNMMFPRKQKPENKK